MKTRYSRKSVSKTQINRHKSRKRRNPLLLFAKVLGTMVLVGSFALFIVSIILGDGNAKAGWQYISVATETIPIEIKAVIEEESEVLGANTAKARYAEVLADPELMKKNNIHSKYAASEDVITIGFIGDILFDDEYSAMSSLKSRGGILGTSITEDTLSLMRSMDLMVVNNEFPYTERGTRTEGKEYTFRADTNTANYLVEMGADVAILANNHVLDFGQVGLEDTLTTLNNVGVVPVGAGMNIEEASKPVYFIVNDTKIAIVAATQIERNDCPNTIGATETSGGTFRCWRGDLIYQKITEAKNNADFVIACIHWGTEKETTPDCWQLAQAPLLESAGADLIIGDHPHVLQGITYYNDTPCIYSLGNFWFNSSTIDTGMVKIEISDNKLKSFQFIPAIQQGNITSLTSGDESVRILNSMRNMSPGIVIDENGYVVR